MRRPTDIGGHLLWTIGDGGAQLGTAISAFASALSAQDRRQNIDFISTR